MKKIIIPYVHMYLYLESVPFSRQELISRWVMDHCEKKCGLNCNWFGQTHNRHLKISCFIVILLLSYDVMQKYMLILET